MLYGPAYSSGRRFCRWTEHMPGADRESVMTKVKAGIQRALCHASGLLHHNSQVPLRYLTMQLATLCMQRLLLVSNQVMSKLSWLKTSSLIILCSRAGSRDAEETVCTVPTAWGSRHWTEGPGSYDSCTDYTGRSTWCQAYGCGTT